VRILSSPIFVANVEYERQSGRIYKILGSWDWCEDLGVSIPPEITKITGITDAAVAGHRIDERAVSDLLDRVVLVIAHTAAMSDKPLSASHYHRNEAV